MSTPARPYRGVSAEDRRASRRQALLDAALDLLTAPDHRPVTMTAVCERAGLTERYFYESFKSRDALLAALLDTIGAEITQTINEALDATSGNAEDRARASIDSLVAYLGAHPERGRVVLVEAIALPHLRERRRELLLGFKDIVVARAHELFGDEALPTPEDRIAAVIFVGGFVELTTSWITGQVEAEPEQLVAALLRNFVALFRR